MVTLGIDAHKRTHTVVVADSLGRVLGQKTVRTTTAAHLELLLWAKGYGPERAWAVEDCRHLSRRLERDLLAAGEEVRRVPPKLMAHARDSARTYGKSDPIDALAVARAAIREPDLPTARLDGPSREVRLLVDHREDLVAERTRVVNRLRWHLHELDPDFRPAERAFRQQKAVHLTLGFLDAHDGVVAELARRLTIRCGELTEEVNQLTRQIEDRVQNLAPALISVVGCGPLIAAKIVGETADISRFRNKDAYARPNGTAPLPVWSANKERHRLSRVGNRQLNAAIHRIAITQAHYHPGARAYLVRRRAAGDSTPEAIRALKRQLSDVVYRALREDAYQQPGSERSAA